MIRLFFLLHAKRLALGAVRIKLEKALHARLANANVHYRHPLPSPLPSTLLYMDITSIRIYIYGQVHVEKNCSANVRVVMLYRAVSILCDVEP